MEAVALKVMEEDKKAREDDEKKEWKSDTDALRKRVETGATM